jgi:hypothetical protein
MTDNSVVKPRRARAELISLQFTDLAVHGQRQKLALVDYSNAEEEWSEMKMV